MAVISELHQVKPQPWARPAAVIVSAWNHRKLIFRLARREIEARYRGSLLGIAWSVLVPLALLAVYTFVFTVIFEGGRWGLPSDERRGASALVMFTGMILFNLFAECVNRAPWLMLGNVDYIKKVVFPLEALAWVAVTVALFNSFVSSLVLMVGYVLFVGLPSIAVLTLPLVVVPLVLVTVGLTWFLSALGVYLRDIAQFVPVLTTILMFLSPVFYSASALKGLAPYMTVNPLAVPIEQARAILFARQWPNWWLLALHLVMSAGIAWIGLAWFTKTRKGFADVV